MARNQSVRPTGADQLHGTTVLEDNTNIPASVAAAMNATGDEVNTPRIEGDTPPPQVAPPVEVPPLKAEDVAAAATAADPQAALMELLGKTIAAGVAHGMAAAAPPRTIKFGEYDKSDRANNAFQTGPRALLPRPKRTCFQNHVLCAVAGERADSLTNREIELLNAITHSGRYIDRIVEVVLDDSNADEELHIRWNCKTSDMRNNLMMKGRVFSFEDILQLVVDAQTEERADLDEIAARKAARRAQTNRR